MDNFFSAVWGFMQGDVFVGILGLLTIAAIVLVLFRSKMQPAFAFIVVPAILAIILVLLGRYSFGDIETMIKSGFSSTGPTAALFVFSVLYDAVLPRLTKPSERNCTRFAFSLEPSTRSTPSICATFSGSSWA